MKDAPVFHRALCTTAPPLFRPAKPQPPPAGQLGPIGTHEALLKAFPALVDTGAEPLTKETNPMNSDIKTTLKTLNDLIEVLKDGEEGFKSAASDVKVPDLSLVFTRYAVQRAEFASELQARVLALGADVETSGSVAGSIHRGWINLKSALSSNEPHAVLAEAERGEDSAVAAYRKALDEAHLDKSTQDIVSRQYADVKAAHDHVKMLRDSSTYRKAS
jgi:uncharacterized protein (TIGR02284 family)